MELGLKPKEVPYDVALVIGDTPKVRSAKKRKSKERLQNLYKSTLDDNGNVTGSKELRSLIYESWVHDRAPKLKPTGQPEEPKKKSIVEDAEKVFKQWKLNKAKQKMREKKISPAELLKAKMEEEQERKQIAEKSFEAWVKKKDEERVRERNKLKLVKSSSYTTLPNEEQKRKESKKAFEAWRDKKSVQIQKDRLIAKQLEEQLERQRMKEAKQKEEEASQAYQQWQVKKISTMLSEKEHSSRSVSSATASHQRAWRPSSARRSAIK